MGQRESRPELVRRALAAGSAPNLKRESGSSSVVVGMLASGEHQMMFLVVHAARHHSDEAEAT